MIFFQYQIIYYGGFLFVIPLSDLTKKYFLPQRIYLRTEKVSLKDFLKNLDLLGKTYAIDV